MKRETPHVDSGPRDYLDGRDKDEDAAVSSQA
jgi:hypothetical protein